MSSAAPVFQEEFAGARVARSVARGARALFQGDRFGIAALCFLAEAAFHLDIFIKEDACLQPVYTFISHVCCRTAKIDMTGPKEAGIGVKLDLWALSLPMVALDEIRASHDREWSDNVSDGLAGTIATSRLRIARNVRHGCCGDDRRSCSRCGCTSKLGQVQESL